MKKYVYILLLLASVSTLATAQIKIGKTGANIPES